jgi:homoserine O-acetyltransferase
MSGEIFDCGDVVLQNEGRLTNARLVYQTVGRLNTARDNVILYPTSFATSHADIAWLAGPGRALDTERYFIVMPNMLGNGLSASPSQHAPGSFPLIRLFDSVLLQHRLLREKFQVERLKLVVGFSMGGQQAYHWAALFPDMVERLAVICGSAKTSRHNLVFIQGVKAALTGDPAWNGEFFRAPAGRGLKAMARVYAGWGMSAQFYRDEEYLRAGYRSLEDFLVNDWEAFFANKDANDLMAMLGAWEGADISANARYGGDLAKALGSIQASALIMPSRTDMYFSPADSEAEVRLMPNAELSVIDTIWGHRVNNPRQNPADAAFVERQLARLLAADGSRRRA